MGQIWDKNHIKIIKFMQNIINIKFIKVVWKGLFTAVLTGAPDRNRTDDQRFRKPLLYPTELRGRVKSGLCKTAEKMII